MNTWEQKLGKCREWLFGVKSGKTHGHSEQTTQAGGAEACCAKPHFLLPSERSRVGEGPGWKGEMVIRRDTPVCSS